MLSTNEWIDLVVSESETLQNIILNQRLDDSFELGRSLKAFAQMDLSERSAGVLLIGSDGTGKHHAAYHIIQALEDQNNDSFVPMFLHGFMIAEQAAGFHVVPARLSALLGHFRERGQGVCLVLDEPEECPYCRQLYLSLGAAVQKTRGFGSESEQELFLILIAKQRPSLPSLLQDELMTIVCELPTLDQRKTYLDRRAKAIRRDISLEQLAELTENCSYRALGEITDRIQLFLDSFDTAPNDETLLHLINQLREQIPQERENPVAQSINSLRQVMEEMVGKLSNLSFAANTSPANNFVQDIQLAPQTSSISNPLNPTMEEIENMPVRELSADLFGEEFNKGFLLSNKL